MRNNLESLKILVAAALCSAALTGCGDSRDDFVITNTGNNNPIQAPVAVDDTVNALGNATLQQSAANGVLINDTVNGGDITAFDATSANGGTVVLNADGSFTYTPTFGFTGTDSFDYTLTNSGGASTATVTVNVNGEGFFVDNSLGTNGVGSQADPFNNLGDAVAAAQTGDTIFVYRGDGTSTNQSGTITLPEGVNLIGQAQGLVVSQTIVPQGDRPVITGPVILGGDNTVAGLEINGSATGGVGGANIDNAIIENNVFTNAQDNFIELESVTGTFTIAGNTFTVPGDNDDCINLEVDADTAAFDIQNNIFTDDNTTDPDDGIYLEATSDSTTTLNVAGNQFTGDDPASAFNGPVRVETADTADVTLTVTQNTFTDASGDAALTVRSRSSVGVDTTFTQNTIDGSDDDGVDYEWNTDVADTFAVTISNNNITDIISKGIDIDGFTAQSSTGIFFIRDNDISDTDDDTVRFDLGTEANACLDFFGNTVDGDVEFNNSSNGTFDVERLLPADGGPLDDAAVNDFTGGMLDVNVNDFTSRAAGYCQNQLP